MHLLVSQSRTIDAADAAIDLGQSPGDMVVLSFSDSDLGALAAAVERRDSPFSLRLASLQQLRHPYSVDLYAGRTLSKARFVLVRLLGGLDYWRYGVDELARLARRQGFDLAIVPGDHREDARLDEASTLPVEDLRRLWSYFQYGGSGNVTSLLGWIETRLGTPKVWTTPKPVPPAGRYRPACRTLPDPRGHAILTFYRSCVLAGDCAPIVALADALAARGLGVTALYATSLKDPEAAAILTEAIAAGRPDVIINTTAFSGRGDSTPSVLDGADCVVLQAILAGSSEAQWQANPRGLGAADLAMNVVLPEMDGRLVTAAMSCKAESPRSEALDFSRLVHRPIASRVAHVADLAAGWAALRRTPRADRRVAMVLSDYPGKLGREAYAIGLDTPASVVAITDDLRDAGYTIGSLPGSRKQMSDRRPQTSLMVRSAKRVSNHEAVPESRLMKSLVVRDGLRPPDHEGIENADSSRPRSALMDVLTKTIGATLPITDYHHLLAELPPAFVAPLHAAWGDPADDPAVTDGAFRFRVLHADNLVIALQPDRGRRDERRADYHDTALPPRHAYVAFYLWLRHRFGMDVLIHCGTHGTLEWLPGKAVALDATCAPEVLLGPTPLVYPFIVNNPGEAAQAKRRNAAVTIGHMTPELTDAGTHGATLEIEALFDEYATAETLDPKRAKIIAKTLMERSAASGLASEAGVDLAQGQTALVALDAWLCDIKEMRIRDGLHVFGRDMSRHGEDDGFTDHGTFNSPMVRRPRAVLNHEAAPRLEPSEALLVRDALRALHHEGADARAACAAGERAGLLAALDGRFVPAGPAGAPSRGRMDVLPTGRNLYGTDPRAVPSRTAVEIGRRAADAVAERYAQDHGDWPRRLVLDLWASATMRTGGEDLAQAFAHLGVRPQWDAGSARVAGFEILPFAALARPRVDVTLRISGLFRDVFPMQIALFDEAVRAVAELDEEDDVNPLAAARRQGEMRAQRIFGAAPSLYGVGLGSAIDADSMAARDDLGRAYLAAGSHAYGGAQAEGTPSGNAFTARVAEADAFVHVQDMADLDVLDAQANVEAEAGFAAAAHALGATPALYHLDATSAERAIVRTQTEEIARVVRGRAANPRWIAGQMRHGHRGAAEIAETIDNLYAMAVMSDAVKSRQFDLVFDATVGTPEVRDFLLAANPDAARAIAQRFRDAATRGVWTSRRNSDAATLADLLAAA